MVSGSSIFAVSYASVWKKLGWVRRNAVVGLVKLALEAGKATPAPPVGPALGSKGVNIMAFCKEYNAKTADKPGYIIPVEITVYDVCGSSVFSSFPSAHFCSDLC